MTTAFLLDALNQAICQRVLSRVGGLIHHSDSAQLTVASSLVMLPQR